MMKIPAPRLMPATIAALGTLLMLKCGVLLQVVLTHGDIPGAAMVGAANAASTEQTKEPTKPAPSSHGEAPVHKEAPAHGEAQHGEPTKVVSTSVQTPTLPPAPEGPPPVSESEKALLQDLRQRRTSLEARADAIAARESVLIATERKLGSRVDELQALQKKLEGLDAAQKQKEEAGWDGLVKVYETMKPKEAAAIFNDLSMPVMLHILDRMKDSKAASIMAAMTPDKARDVTGELAQMRTGRDASGAPVAGLRNNLPGG